MNQKRMRLIQEAQKQGSAFWTRVADDLAKPGRNRRHVNLSRLSRATKDGETVIVPGKVLGDGEVAHTFTVAAFDFSESARVKLSAAKCTAMTIEEFLKKHPKGAGRIIG